MNRALHWVEQAESIEGNHGLVGGIPIHFTGFHTNRNTAK